MAKPTSTLWRVADDRLDGKLAERIAELRADDRSWRWIADRLATEIGFRPTHETLRQWGETLGVPERPGPVDVAS